MDLVRFGVVIRALRRRRGWRQLDLAAASGVSQPTVSMVERGHADRLLLGHVVAVVAALEARMVIDIRWRGGELDRLIDQDHARLAAAVGTIVAAAGWVVQYEVTYAIYGQNGSVDILAWHAPTRTVLVIEIKTEITSAEATIRKLDEKARLAAQIAHQRFGWQAATVGRLLVVQKTTTARRRLEEAGRLFDAAFPARNVDVRRWLRSPNAPLSGLMFVPLSSPSTGKTKRGGRHRVRRDGGATIRLELNVASASTDLPEAADLPTILTNRT